MNKYYWNDVNSTHSNLTTQDNNRLIMAKVRYHAGYGEWTVSVYRDSNRLGYYYMETTRLDNIDDAKAFAYALVVMNE